MISVDVVHCGNACGWWRVIHPYSFWDSERVSINVYEFHSFNISSTTASIVVLQRPMIEWKEEIKKLQEKGKKVVIELDDMFPVLSSHPQTGVYGKDSYFIKFMYECLEVCDAISVATPELQKFYQSKFPNKKTEVFFNTLQTYQRKDLEIDRNYFNLFWSGSETHEKDLRLIKKPIEEFLKAHSDSRFYLMSYAKLDIFDSSLQEQIIWLNSLPLEEFFGVQFQFDVALCPLEDNVFNDCKSEVRILEATRNYVPCICSNVAPFRRFFQKSGGTGCLLASNEKKWGEHLEMLYKELKFDGTKPLKMTLKAKETEEKEYNIHSINKQREKFYLELCL